MHGVDEAADQGSSLLEERSASQELRDLETTQLSPPGSGDTATRLLGGLPHGVPEPEHLAPLLPLEANARLVKAGLPPVTLPFQV